MVRRAASWLLVALLAGACGKAADAPGPLPATSVTALVGGRVQAGPETAAIPDGVVIIANCLITAVGWRADVPMPPAATVIDGAGATVTAAFWNTHVHFTGSPFREADTAPAAKLADGLRAMLTSYGVVHVVDTASWLPNTLALRCRGTHRQARHRTRRRRGRARRRS